MIKNIYTQIAGNIDKKEYASSELTYSKFKQLLLNSNRFLIPTQFPIFPAKSIATDSSCKPHENEGTYGKVRKCQLIMPGKGTIKSKADDSKNNFSKNNALNWNAMHKMFKCKPNSSSICREIEMNEALIQPNENFNEKNFYNQQAREFITKCYGTISNDENQFIGLIFKKEDGSSLDKCSSLRNAPLIQKIKVMQQIADGLHVIHSHDMIHTDLSTRNIMISNTNKGYKATIIDLGNAEKITNKDSLPLNASYCAPTEAYLILKKYKDSKKNYRLPALQEIFMPIFRPWEWKKTKAQTNQKINELKTQKQKELQNLKNSSFDIPSLGYLMTKICFSSDIWENLSLINHNDFKSNVAARNLIKSAIDDITKVDLQQFRKDCNLLAPKEKDKILNLFKALQEKKINLFTYLNDPSVLKHKNTSQTQQNNDNANKMSDEQVEFLRQMFLACVDENPENRPTAAQIGECFELFAAGYTDFNQAIKLAKFDRPNLFEENHVKNDAEKVSTLTQDSDSSDDDMTEPEVDVTNDTSFSLTINDEPIISKITHNKSQIKASTIEYPKSEKSLNFEKTSLLEKIKTISKLVLELFKKFFNFEYNPLLPHFLLTCAILAVLAKNYYINRQGNII